MRFGESLPVASIVAAAFALLSASVSFSTPTASAPLPSDGSSAFPSILLATSSARSPQLAATGRFVAGLGWVPFDGAHLSLRSSGAWGSSAWEGDGSLQVTVPQQMPGGTVLGLTADLRSRPVRASLEDGNPESALPLRRVEAARMTSLLRRRVASLEVHAGASWAGGRGGETRSAPGVVFGISGSRGVYAFGIDGRSGRGWRSVAGPDPVWTPEDSLESGGIKPPAGMTRTSVRTAFWDARVHLAAARGPWRGAGHLGYRLGRSGFGSRRFAGFETSWHLKNGLALVAASRFEPSAPEQRLPARRVSQVGIALCRWPGVSSRGPAPGAEGPPDASLSAAEPNPRERGVRISPSGDGRTVIECRLPEAARVAAMGDFTDWSPRPMARAKDGWWRLVLSIAPGPHRLSISVDGGPWTAPRGLPSSEDGFGGSAGLFVVD